MITLAPRHPARLALGAARVAAAAACEPIHALTCADAVRYAAASRDLTAEIATDASYLLERMASAASDGHVTPAELAELRGIAAEIQSEATTGQILSRAH